MTISTKLFSSQMLDQFKLIEGRLQKLQTQISTGSRIPQSSEQPMDAVTLSARRVFIDKPQRGVSPAAPTD